MSDPSGQLTAAVTANGAGKPRAQRLRILFTEGSSISARQSLYDLGPQHTIDVLDPSGMCQCRFSKFVRRWYRCPPFAADPRGYLRSLGQRLKAEKYDVVLPMHDEVFLLARVRDELSRRVGIAMAEFSAVSLLQSKLQFLDLARELGLRCPETLVAGDLDELTGFDRFPVFLKLEVGTAGQTVKFAKNRDEIESTLAEFQRLGWWQPGEKFLLQQPAIGDQGTVRGIFRHGQLVASHCTRLSMRGVGGSAVARDSIDLPGVLDDMRRLGARLNWHGALFGEYFFDAATGQPSYIEFNPRIGSSANATKSGVNLMQAWVDVSLGRNTPAATSQSGVSTHASMLILISRALENAGRGELLGEIHRQLRGQGIYCRSLDELTRPRDDWMSLLPYLWVAGRLLASPNSVRAMVHQTVKNYALSGEAAEQIRRIPQEELAASLS